MLLDELRRVAALVDPRRPLTQRAFNLRARTKAYLCCRRFGGWREALQAAGIGERYSGFRVSVAMRAYRTRSLSDDEMLDVLRRIARPDGTVTGPDLARRARMDTRSFIHRFGSWPEALRRAGLKLSALAHRPAKVVPLRRRRAPMPEAEPISTHTSMAEPSSTHITMAEPSSPYTSMAERLRSAHLRDIPVGLRYRVMLRDDFRCALCGDSPALTRGCVLEIDHVVPWSRGGRTTLENLRTLCRPCNRGKGARLEERGMEERGEPEEKP